MDKKYDTLSGLEKAAVIWYAEKIHNDRALKHNGAGVYARTNPQKHIDTLKENIASGSALQTVVGMFRRKTELGASVRSVPW